ncbi:MAG TPA: hypothetical protein VHV28_03550 [Solirubrobacteraceae bacterium]|jgi:hypothetical protein|nr:hypothetical protein [Solirubrobacteraceae bacterium]
MSGFVVDSRTLVAVRDTLGRLQDQLTGMHTVIWHQWGTLGGNALEAELEHFCGTWHYGVSELGGQLQDLTRRLGEAADAYDRIEQRITHAAGGSGSGSSSGGAAVAPTGSGHTSAHHTAAKHPSAAHHTASEHPEAKHHATPGGAHYSGGAPIAPASGGGHAGSDKPAKGDKHPGVGSGTTVIGGGPAQGGGADHNGGTHHGGGAKHNGNSGSGSGTTVIAPGPTGGSHPGHHPSSGSGSGTTVIGGGPTQSSGSRGGSDSGSGSGPGSGSGSGSGTTTVDAKIHQSEERQRAELASVLKMATD